jgi:plastocyanin
MFRTRAAFSAIIVIAAAAACSAGNGARFVPQGQPISLPPIDGQFAVTANLPARTIGEELPDEGLGTYKSGFWKATLGGFTQQRYSQALGFPPGTKVTIRNLSKKISHTLDVVAKIDGPPANFPKNPTLHVQAHGKGVLGAGYASGIIAPGKSVTVTLKTAGTYLIGCAFHYGEGMHDVLTVARNAKPGQQASPPPKGTSHPSSTPSTGPSPTGYSY